MVKAVHMPFHKIRLPRKKKSHKGSSIDYLAFLFLSQNPKEEEHTFKVGSYTIYRQDSGFVIVSIHPDVHIIDHTKTYGKQINVVS